MKFPVWNSRKIEILLPILEEYLVILARNTQSESLTNMVLLYGD